jgi:hypothetical protein
LDGFEVGVGEDDQLEVLPPRSAHRLEHVGHPGNPLTRAQAHAHTHTHSAVIIKTKTKNAANELQRLKKRERIEIK